MANAGGSSYFVDTKRGEVGELCNLLRNPEIQRDPVRRRGVVQKVIASMTQGIDVAPLFSEMIMASATKDLVQKKLVYLYLRNYAESHSDLALLVINSFQKDCSDDNPMIRGLALRNMCSLRINNLWDYVINPLRVGMRDKNAYVRKAAALGIVKLYYLFPAQVRDSNFSDTLYTMLQDRDAGVASNALFALDEVLAEEGGVVVSRDVAEYLLSRLSDFDEWACSLVMGVLHRYTPDSEEAVFDILNILDERLKHANSGVVLAAAKLFVHLTAGMPDLHEDVYQRIATPLLTQMAASGTPEIAYSVLHHVQLLHTRQRGLLAAHYKSFYCRYNDPPYVKHKKMEILVDVAEAGSAEEIVDELSEYVTDMDRSVSRRAIQSAGRIALRVPSVLNFCAQQLLTFLTFEDEDVVAETILVSVDLLRKYDRDGGNAAGGSGGDGALAARLLPELRRHLRGAGEDPAAKAAVIWMLGEYGNSVLANSPYLLEGFIEQVDDRSCVDGEVRLQLLTAALKLFLHRPAEMQRALGRLLDREIEEEMHVDVRDRALLYYRLLRDGGVERARQVVLAAPPPRHGAGAGAGAGEFAEDQVFEMKDRVFDEFNTLAVIYQQPSATFLSQQPPYTRGTLGTRAHSSSLLGGSEPTRPY